MEIKAKKHSIYLLSRAGRSERTAKEYELKILAFFEWLRKKNKSLLTVRNKKDLIVAVHGY